MNNEKRRIAIGPLLTFLGVTLTALATIFGVFYNEHSKRIYEEYQRREERYSQLLQSLKGFYVSSPSKELREEFLNQLNLCWMYCPDEVIQKGYKFLFMVHTGAEDKYTNAERAKALGDFVLAIRKDLIDREPLEKTELTPEDFKRLIAK